MYHCWSHIDCMVAKTPLKRVRTPSLLVAKLTLQFVNRIIDQAGVAITLREMLGATNVNTPTVGP
jgi:hypothetical protein